MKRLLIGVILLLTVQGVAFAEEYNLQPMKSKSKVSMTNVSTVNTMGTMHNSGYLIRNYNWEIEFTDAPTAANLFLLGSVNGTSWYPVDQLDYTAKTMDAGAAVDVGGGIVGLPSTAHGYTFGDNIEVIGSTNYDAEYRVLDSSTSDQIQVFGTYTAETFGGTEEIGLKSTLRHVLNRRVKRLRGYVEAIAGGSVTITTIPGD